MSAFLIHTAFLLSSLNDLSQIDSPTTLEETRDAVTVFRTHYNDERPNQSVVCHNAPPSLMLTADDFARRSKLPMTIDPERWLKVIAGSYSVRKVKSNAGIEIDSHHYSVPSDWIGQQITLQVEAASGSFLVWSQKTIVKRLPIKGLVGHPMPWDGYLAMIQNDARSQWQEYLLRHHQKRMKQQAGSYLSQPTADCENRSVIGKEAQFFYL